MKVEPLEPAIGDMLRSGEIGEMKDKKQDGRTSKERGLGH